MARNIAKVTVIGGSGFVGTYLCGRLAADNIPFQILDLNISESFPEKTIKADVRELDQLRASISGDAVINLAAIHRDDIQDKSEYERTNVDGAKNIVTVCLEKGIKKVVFTSSVAVYGFSASVNDESAPIAPFNSYGASKFKAEEVFRNWEAPGRKLSIIRPTVIFGPGNRGNVFNLLQFISSGKFLMVGRGENKKSMAYVENVADFLVYCLSSDNAYELFNYIDEPDVSMNELVSYVNNSLGKTRSRLRLPYALGISIGYLADAFTALSKVKLPISSIRVKKFCTSTSFSSSYRLAGFVPKYTLYDGLHETLMKEFVSPNPNQQTFYTE